MQKLEKIKNFRYSLSSHQSWIPGVWKTSAWKILKSAPNVPRQELKNGPILDQWKIIGLQNWYLRQWNVENACVFEEKRRQKKRKRAQIIAIISIRRS